MMVARWSFLRLILNSKDIPEVQRECFIYINNFRRIRGEVMLSTEIRQETQWIDYYNNIYETFLLVYSL
jgi:hypothetical protein